MNTTEYYIIITNGSAIIYTITTIIYYRTILLFCTVQYYSGVQYLLMLVILCLMYKAPSPDKHVQYSGIFSLIFSAAEFNMYSLFNYNLNYTTKMYDCCDITFHSFDWAYKCVYLRSAWSVGAMFAVALPLVIVSAARWENLVRALTRLPASKPWTTK